LRTPGRARPESTLGVIAGRVPQTPVYVGRSATLATRGRAGVSTALTTFALAREVVAIHVCAANIALGHAHVAATPVPCSTLESFAAAVMALHVRGRTESTQRFRERALPEGALGVFACRVPQTAIHVGRPAALAAGGSAGVPTALATSTLAREIVSLHVCAANVACSHAHVATATGPRGTLEAFTMPITTLHVGAGGTTCRAERTTLPSWERDCVESTLGVVAGWIPTTLFDVGRPAALAAWSCAGVSTALASLPLAREAVALHVGAANIACGHTHVATTAVASSALESFAAAVVALHSGGTLASLHVELAAESQERAPLECTFSVIAGRVPQTCVDVRRSATLAAWSSARVPTALATSTLAGEVIAFHVCATDVACGHTDVTATSVPCSALESFAMAVVALHRGGMRTRAAWPLHSRERAHLE